MLKSADGKVFYAGWETSSPNAVIVLVHGLGGYSGRFFELGPFLAGKGLQVYAIELKGFGGSPSEKGHIGNFKTYTEELKTLVKLAKNKTPGKKVFVFGESMGGLITLDFSMHHRDMIDGIILVSPALKDRLPIPTRKKIAIFLTSIFNPRRRFNAEFNAEMFTRDPAMAKKINEDPMEVRSLSAKFFLSIMKALIYVNMNPKRIKLPLLMLLAGKDKMVSSEAAGKFFRKVSSKDKELKSYSDMYHALYVDKGREKVFDDIVDWIEKHL